jgi:hypothetical protein
MLLAFLLIQGTPPIAVDVAGMPPQLAYVRQVAAARGWPVICEGRSGERRVLRLDTHGADSETIDAALDNRASETRYYYPQYERPGATCDLEPPHASGPPYASLAFGTEPELRPLQEIARACGFARARIRELRPGDIPAGYEGRISPTLLTLSAEEDITPRDGPLICFIQMQSPPGAEHPRRPALSSRRPLP